MLLEAFSAADFSNGQFRDLSLDVIAAYLAENPRYADENFERLKTLLATDSLRVGLVERFFGELGAHQVVSDSLYEKFMGLYPQSSGNQLTLTRTYMNGLAKANPSVALQAYLDLAASDPQLGGWVTMDFSSSEVTEGFYSQAIKAGLPEASLRSIRKKLASDAVNAGQDKDLAAYFSDKGRTDDPLRLAILNEMASQKKLPGPEVKNALQASAGDGVSQKFVEKLASRDVDAAIEWKATLGLEGAALAGAERSIVRRLASLDTTQASNYLEKISDPALLEAVYPEFIKALKDRKELAAAEEWSAFFKSKTGK